MNTRWVLLCHSLDSLVFLVHICSRVVCFIRYRSSHIYRVVRDLFFVNGLLLFQVCVALCEGSHGVVCAQLVVGSEYLCHCNSYIVLLAAHEIVARRRILRHPHSLHVSLLPLLVEGALVVGVFAQKVSFPGEAVSCAAQACNQAILHVLLQASRNLLILKIVRETIGVGDYDVEILHIDMPHLHAVCHLAGSSAALIRHVKRNLGWL